MSHKYNKRIEQTKEEKNKIYRRYWEDVNKKMVRKYFWQCRFLKKDCFKMTFPHSLGEYDKKEGKFYNADFAADNEMLIVHYAKLNGFEICDENLMGNKSVYWFRKVVELEEVSENNSENK